MNPERLLTEAHRALDSLCIKYSDKINPRAWKVLQGRGEAESENAC